MQEFNSSLRTKEMPELRAGDVVKVHRKINEGGKERTQIFEGMIISIKGKQSSSPMITVRKVSNGTGVELVLPLYSPIIDKIEMVKRAKVRRSKLYFTRERSLKSLRLKYAAPKDFLKPGEKKEEVIPETEEEIVASEAKSAEVEEVKEKKGE